jgi:RNA polymerase sigma-70 factor (ECF subfamily)
MELGDHFFRREYGRLVAVLTHVFGVHNLALVEDVVQDAFCRALQVWPFQGAPANPSAWLMTTAKRRAIDVLRRERTARTYAPEYGRLLESEWTLVPLVSQRLEQAPIEDDLLRMMFSCCHPRLKEEAQVALILHILCGFGIDEVAAAFLDTVAATRKRITRAKQLLASSKRLFDLTDEDFATRLSAVQRALYLLFNEGYHGASAESVVRSELCDEARYLVTWLVTHARTATPATRALAALMCLHAARLPGRLDPDGHLRALAEQDRSQWDRVLIAEGKRLLELSVSGAEVSEYHLEAGIAMVHAAAARAAETNWAAIVDLYDALLRMRPSPVIALNRAIAVAQHAGPERGLEAMGAIPDRERLTAYPFYFAALGEMELQCGRAGAARRDFERAMAVARSPQERTFFARRVAAC